MHKYVILCIAVLLMGSECEQRRLDSLDRGFMLLYPNTDEPALPAFLPWTVVVDNSVLDEEYGFDPVLVEQAVDWWNTVARRDGFVRAWFDFEDECYADDLCLVVSTGYTGDSDAEDEFGIFTFTLQDSRFVAGDIVVSSDITYDADTVLAVLKHEMGHSLGLADDVYSLDLNSIMCSPLLISGRVTDNDWHLLVENLP